MERIVRVRFLVESLGTGCKDCGNILSGGDMSDVKGLVLIKRVGFRVGKGNRVWFWVDGWLGVGPLFILFLFFKGVQRIVLCQRGYEHEGLCDLGALF